MPTHNTNLPILLLGALGDIRTTTRLEKMAFLCDKKTFADSPYYEDWMPHYYGPYSQKLIDDVNYHSSPSKRFIDIRLIEDSFANVVKIYSLTIKGRYFYSKLLPYFDEKPDQKPDKIKELVGRYQKDKTNNKLIDFVYKNYEKYTTNSLIKNRVEKRWKDQN